MLKLVLSVEYKEVSRMANIKSAKKRILVTASKTANNRTKKSRIKTYIKKFELALEQDNMDEAKAYLRTVEKYLDKAAAKNILSKQAASRKVSRLTKRMNKAM
jgi:small subunit ribosomal protein S20